MQRVLFIKLEACTKCRRVLLNDRERVECRCGYKHQDLRGGALASAAKFARRYWRVPYAGATQP